MGLSFVNVRVLFVAIFVAAVMNNICSATEITVGDGTGWTTSFDYQAWSKDKTFKIGDTLVFKYPVGVHNVVEVDENGFTNCRTSNELGKTFTSGNDQIALDKLGNRWFICGIPGHCDLGMKLSINVIPI
ncbi:mavicyanin-like [Cannabis sativa]|uniref:mavicyanin-like n=1 Tax=Cannabis sativa TaxID=3483 RepID=UPI0029CA8923|nr:mavicyanin-like [Cannabis sativa]